MAITYRPNDKVLKEIEALKVNLGINTATKLIDYLVLNHSALQRQIRDLDNDNDELREELQDKNNSIESFKSSLNHLLK